MTKIYMLIGAIFLQAVINTGTEAATFIVSNLADDDLGSLRQAITFANNEPGDDTIIFGQTGTITLITGHIKIVGNLTISGPGASLLAISGNNQSRIFVIEREGPEDVTVNIDGVTLREGNAQLGPDNTCGDNYQCAGGAIINLAGNLTVTNSILTQNSAMVAGAIMHMGDYGLPTSGSLTVRNTIFSNNSSIAPPGHGGSGAIQSQYEANGSGLVRIENSVFSGNSARAGGAMSLSGKTIISDCTMIGNSAYSPGGAILNGSELTVINSTFFNNSASVYGGAIHTNTEMPVTVKNSTFSSNSATAGTSFGGGISNYGPGQLILENTTFTGNSANLGGGIYNNDLIVSTVTTLANTIIANSPRGGSCGGNVALITDLGYNLTDDATCNFLPSTSLPNTAPNLGPLADNGGPTQTHALLAGSPAIDRIHNGVNGCGTDITTDQRGVTRPQGASRLRHRCL